MNYPIKIEIPEDCSTLLDITDESPGFSREVMNGSEVYLSWERELIEDEDELDRLQGLSIPPAWQDVWICPHEDGYLQCTGRDAQGRKQYIYHTMWHEYRAAQKYARLLDFGRSLTDLRRCMDSDLRQRKPSRARTSALGVGVLDRTAMRVGHELYTKAHGSHGLTTLYKRHCTHGSTTTRFEFTGKSGVARQVKMSDRRLCSHLGRLMELPGDYLFQYQGEDGTLARLHANHVNDYISRTCGEHASAKSFRTWQGTLRAFHALLGASSGTFDEELAAQQRATYLREAIAEAATFLGNTVSVCRQHYIHGALLEAALTVSFWEQLREVSARTMREREACLIAMLEELT